MGWNAVSVVARWEANGRFEPGQFSWQGKIYQVESTGRAWEDEAGYHILCMAFGGPVYELVFRLNPAGWWMRTAANGPAMI